MQARRISRMAQPSYLYTAVHPAPTCEPRCFDFDRERGRVFFFSCLFCVMIYVIAFLNWLCVAISAGRFCAYALCTVHAHTHLELIFKNRLDTWRLSSSLYFLLFLPVFAVHSVFFFVGSQRTTISNGIAAGCLNSTSLSSPSGDVDFFFSKEKNRTAFKCASYVSDFYCPFLFISW